MNEHGEHKVIGVARVAFPDSGEWLPLLSVSEQMVVMKDKDGLNFFVDLNQNQVELKYNGN